VIYRADSVARGFLRGPWRPYAARYKLLRRNMPPPQATREHQHSVASLPEATSTCKAPPIFSTLLEHASLLFAPSTASTYSYSPAECSPTYRAVEASRTQRALERTRESFLFFVKNAVRTGLVAGLSFAERS
jgi:hypothetical protein